MDIPERFTWEFRRRDIREKIDTPDALSCFLTWPVSAEALYTMDWKYAGPRLEVLQQSPEWPRYKAGIRKFRTGHPVRKEEDQYDPHLILQAYHLDRLLRGEHVSSRWVSVYEFGGGFGSMTLLMKRMGFYGAYVIQDFPELIEVQQYFLKGENANRGMFFASKPWAGNYSIFIANCSLDEADEESRLAVWEAINADFYEICYHGNWKSRDMNKVMADLAYMKQDTVWECHADEIYPGQSYLIGRRE